MKRNLLLLLSVLVLGVSGNALAGTEKMQASTFPADAEASFDLPAIETYAERQARLGNGPEAWGVSKREVAAHEVFPFGGGYIDD